MKNLNLPVVGEVSGLQVVTGVNAGFESLQKSIGGALAKSVAGGVNVTLTEAECEYGMIDLTGAITANINVIVPASTMRIDFKNSTTGGSWTVTVKTSAGTGVLVPRGAVKTLSSDGTNVLDAESVLILGKTLGNYTETVFAITDAASVALNPANGPIQTWTLGASRAATDSFIAGQSLTLQVAATAFAITWPTITWVGGTAPTLASAKTTIIVLWKVGTTLFGAKIGEA